MKLPAKLVILGRECPIDWSGDMKADEGEHKPWGEFIPMEFRVLISKDLTNPEHRLRALIHESVHAGLEVSGQTNLFDSKTEEAICTVMEQLVIANLDTFAKVLKARG